MVNITLFEIHLEDASFEANAPFSDAEAEDAADAADEYGIDAGGYNDGDDDGGPSKLVPLVVGLVLLVGLAALVRKLRGGGDDGDFEDDTVDPIDVETT
jgi:hypothetical protein